MAGPAVTAPGSFREVELDRILAAAHRQAHAKALGIDQIGFRRQADQMQLMAAEQEFRGEQRAVGRAHQQDVVGRHYAPPGKRNGRPSPASDRRQRAGHPYVPPMLLASPGRCNAGRRAQARRQAIRPTPRRAIAAKRRLADAVPAMPARRCRRCRNWRWRAAGARGRLGRSLGWAAGAGGRGCGFKAGFFGLGAGFFFFLARPFSAPASLLLHDFLLFACRSRLFLLARFLLRLCFLRHDRPPDRCYRYEISSPGARVDVSPRWPNRSTRPYGRLEVWCPPRSA